jgi:predicted  nucleic acid-binding Zn-ribbon protein
MAAPTPILRRGLFGYSKKSVRAVLAERDVLVVRGLRELKEAEARSVELAERLDGAQREIADLRGRNRDLDAQLRDTSERFRVIEQSSSPTTTEGMTEILQAAERALGRLTETARRNAEQELGQTERARDDLRSEIDRLAAWRDRVAPLAEVVRRSIEEATAVTAALASRLSELTAAAAPPAFEPRGSDATIIVLDGGGEPAELPRATQDGA